jgi:hypothetical protein
MKELVGVVKIVVRLIVAFMRSNSRTMLGTAVPADLDFTSSAAVGTNSVSPRKLGMKRCSLVKPTFRFLK